MIPQYTVASLLLSSGYSMLHVKEQLGHSSIKVTVDLYGHYLPSENKGAIDSLDDIPKTTTIRNLSASKKEKHTRDEVSHVL